MSSKDIALKTIQGLPENASWEEIEERIRIYTGIGKAEQADTGQPATRPKSNSEGSDKPQPESEGHSR